MFYCFPTPIWLPWRHGHTLLNLVCRVLPLSPSRKYPGCGWSRAYVYKSNPHKGWIFDFKLSIEWTQSNSELQESRGQKLDVSNSKPWNASMPPLWFCRSKNIGLYQIKLNIQHPDVAHNAKFFVQVFFFSLQETNNRQTVDESYSVKFKTTFVGERRRI